LLFELDLLGAPRSKCGAGFLRIMLWSCVATGRWSKETMEERRKYPRTEINEPAYVSSGGSVMTCVVRNISPEGAAIDVENPAFVPARFRLVMAKDGSVHECAVAWIQKNRIGLTFVAAPRPERG
jgi:PilZ domain